MTESSPTSSASDSLAEALEAMARQQRELADRRREITDLNAELEQTNRGLIALYAELEDARQAEARLAAIVHSSGDAMLSLTLRGAIQTWNAGAEKLFGYTAEEAVGAPVAMLLPDSAGWTEHGDDGPDGSSAGGVSAGSVSAGSVSAGSVSAGSVSAGSVSAGSAPVGGASSGEAGDAGDEQDDFTTVLQRIRATGEPGRYDTRLRRKDGSLVDVAVTVSAMRRSDRALTGYSAVVSDITDRLRLESELAAAQATAQVQRELAADRDRIARDLHDMVIQRIFGTGLAVQSIASVVGPEPRKRLQSVISELDTAIAELRTAIYDLHRLPEESSDLRTRLLDLMAEAAEGLGFFPTVTFEGDTDGELPDEIVIQLIAVFREALSNIIRHAQATAAEVRLGLGDELVLRITDNGRGIGQTNRSSGLSNLRSRAESLGGSFTVSSKPGAGTRLDWRVPLTRRPKPDDAGG